VRPTVDTGPVAGHDAVVDEEAAECGEVVVDLAQDVVDGGFVVRPRRIEEGGEEHRESRDSIAYATRTRARRRSSPRHGRRTWTASSATCRTATTL
jgi:hypothetical protein